MRPHTRYAVASALILALAPACSSSSAEPAPSGGDETPAVDGPTQAGSAARTGGGSSQALAATKSVLSAFVEDDPTLDLSKDAAGNADAVAARISSETKSCAKVTVSHASGSATVAVDFGTSCTLGSSGVVVSGKATLTVSAGSGTVSVAFQFAQLTVDGYTLDGTATVSTSDLKTYKLVCDLSVAGLGKVTFDGTAAASGAASDAGASLDLTLAGSGTWSGTDPNAANPGTEGWTCVASGSTFTVQGLHRHVPGCWPDAGTVALSTPYQCTKPKKGGGQYAKTLTTTSTMAFSSTTATTGQVSVTVTVSGGGADGGQGTTTTAKLPAHGSCGT